MTDPMQEIWRLDEAPTQGVGEIVARIESLRRSARLHALREMAGSLISVTFFAGVALFTDSAITRLAALLVAGLSLSLALLSRREARKQTADPALPGAKYRESALKAYDAQIESLARLQHGSVVPIVIGLAFIAADAWAKQSAIRLVTLQLCAIAIAFGLSSFFNFRQMKKIKAERSLLAVLTQGEDPPSVPPQRAES